MFVFQLARRLKLRNLPNIGNMCSGAAIEKLAKNGDHLRYEFNLPMQHYKNAKMCFSSITTNFIKLAVDLEQKEGKKSTQDTKI